MTPDILKVWVDIISGLSVTGILGLFIVLFWKGEIIPRKVVDDLLQNSENSAKIIAAEIKDVVIEAVRRGVREGVTEAVAETRDARDVF